MSEGNGINWGGLIKGIVAGAAILVGVELVVPGLLAGAIAGIGGMFAASGGAAAASPALTGAMSGMGLVLTKAAGLALGGIGLSYLLSDKPSNSENGGRHAQDFTEAKESFAAREDIRKMQTVMKMRMAASGHEPAAAMAAPGR